MAKTDVLARMSAADLAAAIADGQHTSEQAVEACLARIAEVDPQVDAWAFLKADFAREQARSADRQRGTGRPIGPLHGVPLGLKDIIDTRAMPTENGTVLDAGRRSGRDAAIVSRLKAAGAVIMGKTVTTELAYFAPSKTRNPHDPARTPGGSSSGSAAAVASGMVPLAVGTQTNGSVIRPASFCGVVGYKPTFGLIPRTGILAQSWPLDTVGVFARSVADAALLAECLIGHDDGDSATAPVAPQGLPAAAAADPPLPPLFAFVRSPVWDQAESDTKEAFAELVAALGAQCDPVDLPQPFARGHAVHRTLMAAGFSRNLGSYYNRGKDQLSGHMREAIEEGRKVLAHDYLAAVDWIEVLNGGLEQIFQRFDAILTPAAPGEAPIGLETTGNPAFCTLWTLCGTPAISLPLLQGKDGMPLGVQLVGRRGYDARLLRTANWLANFVARTSAAA
ncbi:MAG TPA: amidase [Geminicoccaceae bacterium]|jgi:Asp-tRNA(Asn)/Glu-tRNA(Gln) amidotransferase A subunit family amidase|nr:amidase [Geminicoccaceae bacterium]